MGLKIGSDKPLVLSVLVTSISALILVVGIVLLLFGVPRPTADQDYVEVAQMKIIFQSSQLDILIPAPQQPIGNLTVVTFDEPAFDLWRSIVSPDICLRSIYKDFDVSHCARIVFFTQQPLKSTDSIMENLQYALVVVRDPAVEIVHGFMEMYQTIMNEDLVASDLFQEYALSKAYLWRMFYQRWLLNDQKVDIAFLPMHVILENPDGVGIRIADILGVDTSQSQLISEAVLTWHRKIDSDARQFVDLIPDSLYAEIIAETLPIFCHFAFDNQRLPNACFNAMHIISNARILVDSDFKQRQLERWWQPVSVEEVLRKPVNILTAYFKSTNIKREQEVDFAVTFNHQNKLIDMIHLWVDGPKDKSFSFPISGPKLNVIHSDKQPIYSDLFQYANHYLRGQIVILQNVDIFWEDDSIANLQRLSPGMVFALSRHSNLDRFENTKCEGGHNINLCMKYHGSHDVFAFIPPIDPDIYMKFQFKQNTWGAENVVIEGLKYGGYIVENPCEDIKPIHSHCSNERKNTGFHVSPPNEGNRMSVREKQVRPKRLNVIFEQLG
eukprot:Partr_v1_DN28047_c1_g1_i1_m56959 putative NA